MKKIWNDTKIIDQEACHCYSNFEASLGPAVQKTRNAGSNEPILAERYPFACPHVPYW